MMLNRSIGQQINQAFLDDRFALVFIFALAEAEALGGRDRGSTNNTENYDRTLFCWVTASGSIERPIDSSL
jgi:hypothetical protein